MANKESIKNIRNIRKRQGTTTSTVMFFIVFDAIFLIIVGSLSSMFFNIPSAAMPFSADNEYMVALTTDFPTCEGASCDIGYIANWLGMLGSKITAFFGLAGQLFISPFIMIAMMPLVVQSFFLLIFFIQVLIIAAWLIGLAWSGAK